jgi:hypothetical protein
LSRQPIKNPSPAQKKMKRWLLKSLLRTVFTRRCKEPDQCQLLCRVFPEHVLAQVLALLPLADVLAVRCVCRWFADVVDYNWAAVVVPLCVCYPTSAIFYGYLDEGCVPGLTRALGRLGVSGAGACWLAATVAGAWGTARPHPRGAVFVRPLWCHARAAAPPPPPVPIVPRRTGP